MSAPKTTINRSTLAVMLAAIGVELIANQHHPMFGLSHTAILWIDITFGSFMIVSAFVQFILWLKERVFG